MTRLSVPSLNPARLADAVNSLGQVPFMRTLLQCLDAWLLCDHLSVIVFDRTLSGHVAAAVSREPGNVALEAGRLYEKARFYRYDPGTRQMPLQRPGEPVVLRLRASDIQDAAYKQALYARFRLAERASIMDRIGDRWFMLNLYRSTASPAARSTGFTHAELERLRPMAPLLLSLAAKHATLLIPSQTKPARSIPFLESLLARIDGSLTQRECAVCARALAGLTVNGIASDLGIKAPTVATLRRRAYSRLGISSLNQLFALCLEQVARPTT